MEDLNSFVDLASIEENELEKDDGAQSTPNVAMDSRNSYGTQIFSLKIGSHSFNGFPEKTTAQQVVCISCKALSTLCDGGNPCKNCFTSNRPCVHSSTIQKSNSMRDPNIPYSPSNKRQKVRKSATDNNLHGKFTLTNGQLVSVSQRNQPEPTSPKFVNHWENVVFEPNGPSSPMSAHQVELGSPPPLRQQQQQHPSIVVHTNQSCTIPYTIPNQMQSTPLTTQLQSPAQNKSNMVQTNPNIIQIDDVPSNSNPPTNIQTPSPLMMQNNPTTISFQNSNMMSHVIQTNPMHTLNQIPNNIVVQNIPPNQPPYYYQYQDGQNISTNYGQPISNNYGQHISNNYSQPISTSFNLAGQPISYGQMNPGQQNSYVQNNSAGQQNSMTQSPVRQKKKSQRTVKPAQNNPGQTNSYSQQNSTMTYGQQYSGQQNSNIAVNPFSLSEQLSQQNSGQRISIINGQQISSQQISNQMIYPGQTYSNYHGQNNSNGQIYSMGQNYSSQNYSRVTLPIQLGQHVTVIAVGKVTASPFLVSGGFLCPIGFTSIRNHRSILHYQMNSNYRCEILDGNGRPIFRITPTDCPGMSVTSVDIEQCWNGIAAKFPADFEESKKMSGIQFFGLNHPIVIQLIKSMQASVVVSTRPNTDLMVNGSPLPTRRMITAPQRPAKKPPKIEKYQQPLSEKIGNLVDETEIKHVDCWIQFELHDKIWNLLEQLRNTEPVSYTHLTLPTT
eukprot:TRINITY_DN2651_c0_g1_i3.p1 TRINITY_DN2651_c0_g1~~TRINITY_DN2651_c0_g1_i3.p1  ORF type:complete len:725 (-),score=122.79 TRINITY_DN2651_c0_g1_i3:28-2202(-)